MILNFIKKIVDFIPHKKIKKFAVSVCGWIESHPVETEKLIEVAALFRKGQLHRIGAKVLDECFEQKIVRVELSDGKVVTLPLDKAIRKDE